MTKRPPPRRKTRKRAAPKRWTIAEARRNLPTLVRAAADAPQVLYRRDEVVGAIVGAAELAQLHVPADVGAPRATAATLEDAFAELRRINAEEGGGGDALVIPPRRDRRNAFASNDDIDDGA